MTDLDHFDPIDPTDSDRDPVEIAGLASLIPAGTTSATQVDQARAIGEIVAAVTSAQAVPRRQMIYRRAMQTSCESYGLAEQGFYSVPRGGTKARGLTIRAARELFRCFGNFRAGIGETNRDDDLGRSEFKAWAWDLEANAWLERSIIVPHRRDAQGRQVPLETLQEIRESNTNIANRSMRAMILALLPPQFVDEAEARLRATLERGPKDSNIADRRTKAADAFDKLGVDLAQIETRLGRELDQWDGFDLAELSILRTSINRRETTVAEEFPAVTTLDDLPPAPIVAQTPQEAQGDAPADPEGDGGPDDDEAVSGAPEAATGPEPGEGPPTESELRALLKAQKITIGDALKAATTFDDEGRSFGTIGALAKETGMATLVRQWAMIPDAAERAKVIG